MESGGLPYATCSSLQLEGLWYTFTDAVYIESAAAISRQLQPYIESVAAIYRVSCSHV